MWILGKWEKSHFWLTCVTQKPLCLSSLIGNTSIRMLIVFLRLKREKIKLRHTPQQFLSSDVYFLRSFLALSYRLIPFEEKTKTTTMRTTAYKQQCKCMEVIKNELCLSVNVFSLKVLIDKLGSLFFCLQLETKKTRHFTWSSEPREGLPRRMQGKGSTFISQLF